MSVNDYSTTPDNNTSIAGINIGEGMAPGSVNNAMRQMMADIAIYRDENRIGEDVQAYSPRLKAMANVNAIAGKFLYTTGLNIWAAATITAFARALLGASSAAEARQTLGVSYAGTLPLASRSLAEIGEDGDSVMTPLRTAQAIEVQGSNLIDARTMQRIAAASVGELGSYAVLWNRDAETLNQGATKAGSRLYYAGCPTGNNGRYREQSPPGTWAVQGVAGWNQGSGDASNDGGRTSIFKRVS